MNNESKKEKAFSKYLDEYFLNIDDKDYNEDESLSIIADAILAFERSYKE